VASVDGYVYEEEGMTWHYKNSSGGLLGCGNI